jgi:hypothetical protein
MMMSMRAMKKLQSSYRVTVSHQPSAVSRQPSAVSRQPSAVSPTKVPGKPIGLYDATEGSRLMAVG